MAAQIAVERNNERQRKVGKDTCKREGIPFFSWSEKGLNTKQPALLSLSLSLSLSSLLESPHLVSFNIPWTEQSHSPKSQSFCHSLSPFVPFFTRGIQRKRTNVAKTAQQILFQRIHQSSWSWCTACQHPVSFIYSSFGLRYLLLINHNIYHFWYYCSSQLKFRRAHFHVCCP
jgi:hypothetical protein